MRLTASELTSLKDSELSRHVQACPECNATRESLLRIVDDMRQASAFTPSSDYWVGWSPLKNRNQVQVRSNPVKDYLMWLDWVIIPEKTVRWAVAFVLVLSLTAWSIIAQSNPESNPSGLPNRLVISHGPVMVNESMHRGLSIVQNAVSIKSHVERPKKRLDTKDEVSQGGIS